MAQSLEVLRSGLWASVCGGWYYNPSLSRQVNLVHLYLFLALTLGPAVVHLTSGTVAAWTAYLVCVHVFFVVLKTVNWRLHALFDSSEAVEEAVHSDDDNEEDNELDSIKVVTDSNPQQRLAEIRRHRRTFRATRSNERRRDVEIEMKELGRGGERVDNAASSSRGSSPDINHHKAWAETNTGQSTDDGSGRLEQFNDDIGDGAVVDVPPMESATVAQRAKIHLKVDVHSKPVGTEEDFLRTELLPAGQKQDSHPPSKSGNKRKAISASVSRDALMEPLADNEQRLFNRQYRSLIDVGGHFIVSRNSESSKCSRSSEAIDNSSCTCNQKEGRKREVKRSKSAFETSNTGTSRVGKRQLHQKRNSKEDEEASSPLLPHSSSWSSNGAAAAGHTTAPSNKECHDRVPPIENQLISVPPCEWMQTDSEPESPSTPKQLELYSNIKQPENTETSKGAIPKRPRVDSEALKSIMESLLNTENNSDEEQQQSLLLKQRLLEALATQSSNSGSHAGNGDTNVCSTSVARYDQNRDDAFRTEENRTLSTEELRSQQRRLRRARRRAERERRRALAETNSEDFNAASEPMSVRKRKSSSMLKVPQGAHVATSYEDTSEGAIHCFVDEFGNWHSYTFGNSNSSNNNNSLLSTLLDNNIRTELYPGASSTLWKDDELSVEQDIEHRRPSNDGRGSIFDAQSEAERGSVVGPLRHRRNRNLAPRDPLNIGAQSSPSVPTARRQQNQHRSPLQIIADSLYRRSTTATWDNGLSIGDHGLDNNDENDENGAPCNNESLIDRGDFYADSSSPTRIRKYYVLPLFAAFSLKIPFDRLTLLSTLDKNTGIRDNLLSVLLATVTSFLTALVLRQGHYRDLQVLLFCLISGSCQYCLLKSVQPDSSSPSHGYNNIIVYSRAVYFSLCSTSVLLLEYAIPDKEHTTVVYLEKINFALTRDHLIVLLNGLYTYILCFPLLFMLGLMPQVDTFMLYVSEQLEIHLFGGHAAPSLVSSLFCLVRSAATCLLLLGFAYGGMTGEAHSVHTQEILFSLFCALSVALSYHLSRSNSDPSLLFEIMRKHVVLFDHEDDIGNKNVKDNLSTVNESSRTQPCDPLPQKLQETTQLRLMNDMLVCFVMATLVFVVHSSGLLRGLEPNLSYGIWLLALVIGFISHYLLPQLRKELPWTLISHPILKSAEHNHFEARRAAKVMWFEKILAWFIVIEKNVLYPTTFLCAISQDMEKYFLKGQTETLWAALGLVLCTMKCLRASFSDCSKQYLVLLATVLCVKLGRAQDQPFIVVYFIVNIAVQKLHELYLKMQFVFTYVAPWQITWGSAFHAFAQPFSVPHSALLLLQAFIASLISAPLNPILGSAIFVLSYVRPVKFWERDYNTRRVDHTNTRLSSHLENAPGGDDNNFNSIFYEHLTRSLQHSLCGDLTLGRWGDFAQGDCFVLASDYLNCLVHIVEVGNGLVSFQVRGLEFRGTYCQQREVEAISEGVEEDLGLCCCEPGHLPHLLSLNAAFGQRWLAWEVSAVKYILEAYSISDNSAQSILQVYDLRKVLINYYVKSIIFYLLRSPRLDSWLSNSALMCSLSGLRERKFADLDPVFSDKIDEDFDLRVSGITRASFCNVYLPWIAHCARRRDPEKYATVAKESDLITLCLALSLLGRRALYAASQFLSSVEFFLLGLHALFKGDFRITSVRDEWIFMDMELMRHVVSPGVKMSVKLHQDHFMAPDEYDDVNVLYDAIDAHEKHLVIAHESDPAWRQAVLAGEDSLLALRHVLYDSNDEFKIIMLNKRHVSFRVIKLNKECVRGLWAGQQQELIFLRNRNPERGSIQNAKQALRNIINSSCDQPIGYPIYVSPLTTSFIDTHDDLAGVIGGAITVNKVQKWLQGACEQLWRRIVQSCASQSSSSQNNELDQQTRDGHLEPHGATDTRASHSAATLLQQRPSLSGSQASGSKVTALASALASTAIKNNNTGSHRSSGGSLNETSSFKPSKDSLKRNGSKESESKPKEEHPTKKIARIVDSYQVYDNINLGRRIDPLWPNEEWRLKGGRSNWKDWVPKDGMQGEILHTWTPCHREPLRRSHVDKTIVLLQIGDRCVPIVEAAVSIVDEDENKSDNYKADSNDKINAGKDEARDEKEREEESKNEDQKDGEDEANSASSPTGDEPSD